MMDLARWDRKLLDVGQNLPLVGPCLCVLLATLLFRLTDADLLISSLFYDGAWQGGFPLTSHPVLIGLYYWGLLPAWILGLGSVAILLASLFRNVSVESKRAAVFVLAMLVAGPIVLVNVVHKGYWGRPRPDQTVEFGGDQPFLLVMQPGTDRAFQSFPSGHAAAGFAIMAPGFLFYRRQPRLAACWFMLGLTGGLVMGIGRMAQGRHFTSDVLWAAATVYFTGLALDYLLLSKWEHAAKAPVSGLPPSPKARITSGHVAAPPAVEPHREAA